MNGGTGGTYDIAFSAFVLVPATIDGTPELLLGFALEAPEGHPGAAAYLSRLNPDLVAWARQARGVSEWAPCSVCGEGILVARPAVPMTPRVKLADSDGPRCRMTSRLVLGKDGELKPERCAGRHYPLHGPWMASHPLAAKLGLIPDRPW